MELSERLVRLRKQKGLSQFDVAETLHVSRQAISKWESGNSVPSADNLKLLSNLYDVSVDFLLNGEEDQPSHELPSAVEKTPSSNKELHSVERRSRKAKTIFRFVLVLAVAVAIVVTISLVHESQITSVQEMERGAQEESSPPDTAFDIEW